MRRVPRLSWLAAVVALAAFPALGLAQKAPKPPVTLKLGDAAPALDVGKWVQGSAVEKFEKDKIYVVEFWATWCGPCRATIPHLNELSKKHKEVVFIGVDCWERDESLVEPFIKEMGDKMTYRVVLDNKTKLERGAMAVNWMQAAGRNGIPSAFIVDKESKVAWMGHPASMDKPLEEIIAGKFDIKAEAARQEAEQAITNALTEKVTPLMQQGKHAEALTALDEIIKGDEALKQKYGMTRAMLSARSGNLDGAYTILDELAGRKDVEARELGMLAYNVAVSPIYANKRDLDRATKWADLAVTKSQGKDASLLSFQARVAAVKGDWDKAVEAQTKAVDAAEGAVKQSMSKVLESYKEKKLPSQRV